VFRASTLWELLEKEELHIPFPATLPLDDNGETFPYYFVGVEAFPLKINWMRPYLRRMLTNKRHIFNYKLYRAQNSVERAFGMLNSKFKILEGPMCCKEETEFSHQSICCPPQFHQNPGRAVLQRSWKLCIASVV
jgi:hypothetical protein